MGDPRENQNEKVRLAAKPADHFKDDPDYVDYKVVKNDLGVHASDKKGETVITVAKDATRQVYLRHDRTVSFPLGQIMGNGDGDGVHKSILRIDVGSPDYLCKKCEMRSRIDLSIKPYVCEHCGAGMKPETVKIYIRRNVIAITKEDVLP